MLLLLALLATQFAVAVHVHGDAEMETNCQLCLHGGHLKHALSTAATIPPATGIFVPATDQRSTLIDTGPARAPSARGPPSASV